MQISYGGHSSECLFPADALGMGLVLAVEMYS